MNRAGSCAADYICVYNAIQCTRLDWERAKQESDSPTVGEGPGQRAVALGAAYSVTVPSGARSHALLQSRLGAAPTQEAPASRGEADLSAAGIRFSEPPPLSSPWPPCRAGGLVGSGCLLSPRAQH